MMFPQILVTIEEAVLLTGISRASIYSAIKAGKLQSKRISGKRRITISELEKFIGMPLALPGR